MLCEEFVDLPVPRYRLGRACFRIVVPIVISAVPDEYAPGFIQLADQIGPLHPRVNSATLRIPEISPLARSA